MKRKLPKHIPGTFKEWRSKKRKELDAAIKALDVYSSGSFYTPDYIEFTRALLDLKALRKKLREKEWGRAERMVCPGANNFKACQSCIHQDKHLRVEECSMDCGHSTYGGETCQPAEDTP